MSNPSPDQPDAETDDAALAPAHGQDFLRSLHRFTPRLLVTPAIVALNVGLFVVMVASGVDFFSPTAQEVLRWGATSGTRTASGEWWRLLSAMFIHIGLLHLAMNMWVLWSAGPLMERLLGNIGFAITYLLSGLLGGLASLWWTPAVVSAGASGAVFGVYGALIAFLLVRRRVIPLEVLRGLRSSTLVFMGYNLVFGLMHQGIDMAAHVGGLAGGFLCALPLAHPLTEPAWRGRWRRNLMLAFLGAGLVVGLAHLLRSDAGALVQELDRFTAVEKQAVRRYNATLAGVKTGEIADAELARVLRAEVLPGWRAARERVAALRGRGKLRAPFGELARRMLRYMELREQGWRLLADALQQQDRQKAQHAMRCVHVQPGGNPEAHLHLAPEV